MVRVKRFFATSVIISGISFISCFGMNTGIRIVSPQDFYQTIRSFMNFGFSEQEIVRVLKEKIQKEPVNIRALCDQYGNTVLHESCLQNDIQTTKIILDSVDDDEARALVMQPNIHNHPHSHQCIPLQMRSFNGTCELELFLIKYCDKRFGRDFTKKMIVYCHAHKSSAVHCAYTDANFSFVNTILDYIIGQDFKDIMVKPNSYGFTPLERVKSFECPLDIQLRVCLIYQELYAMTDEEVLKMVFGGKQWNDYIDDFNRAKESQVVKA